MQTFRIEQRGGEWVVLPEQGDTPLGTHRSRDAAEAQLRAIEARKHEMGFAPGSLHAPEPLPDLAVRTSMSASARVAILDAQRFSLSTGTGDVYDQIAKPGKYDKDGEAITFNHDTLSAFVQNFAQQRNPLPGDVEHQACYATQNGQPTPLAAKYDTLALVENGRLTAFHSKGSAPQPNAATWADGLYGRRSETTNFGRDLIENKGYGYISPTFVLDGTNEQGQAIGPQLFTASWVVLPFLDGMQPVTFTRFGYGPGLHEPAAEREPVAMAKPNTGPEWDRAYRTAHAAGADAANRSMRAAGRSQWNDDDWNAGAAEEDRILKSLGYGSVNDFKARMAATMSVPAHGAVTMASAVKMAMPVSKRGMRVRVVTGEYAGKQGTVQSDGASPRGYWTVSIDGGGEVSINAAEHLEVMSAAPRSTGAVTMDIGYERLAAMRTLSPEEQRRIALMPPADAEKELARLVPSFADALRQAGKTPGVFTKFNLFAHPTGGSMNPELMAKLGLAADASDADKVAALMKYMEDADKEAMAGAPSMPPVAEEEEDKAAMTAMRRDLGLAADAKPRAVYAAMSATRIPMGEVATLKNRLEKLESERATERAAAEEQRLATFADDAIAAGRWDAAKKANLIAFARADFKAAEGSLLSTGTYTVLQRFTRGGQPLCVSDRQPGPSVTASSGPVAYYGRDLAGEAKKLLLSRNIAKPTLAQLQEAQVEVARAKPELAAAYAAGQ